MLRHALAQRGAEGLPVGDDFSAARDRRRVVAAELDAAASTIPEYSATRRILFIALRLLPVKGIAVRVSRVDRRTATESMPRFSEPDTAPFCFSGGSVSHIELR
jgi:hypothetical protein